MTSSAIRSDAAPDARAIIAAIECVAGDAARPLALHEPCFAGNEQSYVQSCIAQGWVSSAGAFVERFERELAAACGARHAVAAINGTCALHAALVALGVQPEDEVLLPSLTFVATANAVSHAGAVAHFVDVEDASLGIDPEALESYLKRIVTVKNGKTINRETGRILRALVPVHVFGHPCRMPELRRIAADYGLILIEDATEALGSQRADKPVGGSGTGVFSFNGNKIITTGGGGMIVTDDAALAQRLKHLTTTAKHPHAWAFDHDEVGWNYRLPNINAALGVAQLEQLPRFVAAKRALAQRYMQVFADSPGMRILPEPEGTRSNYWLVALVLDKPDAQGLEDMLGQLHAAKLFCRPLWSPLHTLPMYRACPRADLLRTEDLARRIINLPSSAKLGLAYL